jgi:hypothetical protein
VEILVFVSRDAPRTQAKLCGEMPHFRIYLMLSLSRDNRSRYESLITRTFLLKHLPVV